MRIEQTLFALYIVFQCTMPTLMPIIHASSSNFPGEIKIKWWSVQGICTVLHMILYDILNIYISVFLFFKCNNSPITVPKRSPTFIDHRELLYQRKM